MATFAITADIRQSDEKVSCLRKSKKVPGIIYGKSQDPISCTLDSSDFLRLYRSAGESNIIDLKIGKQELEVLVHQTQKHHITGDFTHVDFYAITRGEALKTQIHFNFIGDSLAQKDGAIIQEAMKEISVKCLPRHLVDHFDVDLSILKEAGDLIRISDLGIDSEKYEILANHDDIIVTAITPKVEAVTEETADAEETADTQTEETESQGE